MVSAIMRKTKIVDL